MFDLGLDELLFNSAGSGQSTATTTKRAQPFDSNNNNEPNKVNPSIASDTKSNLNSAPDSKQNCETNNTTTTARQPSIFYNSNANHQ